MLEVVCSGEPEKNSQVIDIVEKESAADGRRQPGSFNTRAVVPTVDLYSTGIFFGFMQKMVEGTVDRRVSLLERRIEERDREVLRTIRKIQTKMLIQKSQARLPWWRRLFQRGTAE